MICSDTPTKKEVILVVDDTPDIIALLSAILKTAYKVRVAITGEKALEIASSNSPPDLVLLDIMMPGMDGYEVCRRLKSNEKTRDIPVIFITALSEAKDETRGFDLGGIDYITKPFNPAVVLSRVKTHLELKKARERLLEQNEQLKEHLRIREVVERLTHHDLKSPLTAVLGFPRMLINELSLTPDQLETLEMIEEAGRRIFEIVNSSLDVCNMEMGRYQPQFVPVDIVKLVRQVAGHTKRLFEIKAATLALRAHGRVPGEDDSFKVRGEELLLYSMLANLIKNALEASPRGETVTVTLGDEGTDTQVIAVHNLGAVPMEIRDCFFEKYTTSNKERGTGLGTYSAKLITETLGGSIDMKTSEESGTIVTIRFPGVEAQPSPEKRGSSAKVSESHA